MRNNKSYMSLMGQLRVETGCDGMVIDSHCHLEQVDFDRDRNAVIERCRREMRAVVVSCSNPKDFSLTMKIVRQHEGFVYATASIHPKYVQSIKEDIIKAYIEEIQTNKINLVGIGETGLDHHWVKDAQLRERQRALFGRFISLAQQIKLPLVVHSRDSTDAAVEILESYGVKRVQMHMFGSRPLLRRVIDRGWFVSVNTLVVTSKNFKKIVRDCPIEQLMLETDSPWLAIGSDGNIKSREELRNEPTAVKLVAEKIGEIKRLNYLEVAKQTTDNALRFFKL